jgi:ribosomal protein S20
MDRSKLCGIAIASMISCFSISPLPVAAAESNTVTVTLSESNRENSQTSFDKIMNDANEKWNSLSNKQKSEVYSLIEKEMKAEAKLLDKLVDLGVMNKEDASMLKARMQERFEELKKNGEFPLSRPKRPKK